jgi:hypothetical protein
VRNATEYLRACKDVMRGLEGATFPFITFQASVTLGLAVCLGRNINVNLASASLDSSSEARKKCEVPQGRIIACNVCFKLKSNVCRGLEEFQVQLATTTGSETTPCSSLLFLQSENDTMCDCDGSKQLFSRAKVSSRGRRHGNDVSWCPFRVFG